MRITTPVRGLAILAAAALGAGTLAAPLTASGDESLTWHEIAFGQSVDLSFSSNVLPEKVGVNHAVPDVPGTVEGEVFMESRGGKIAPGHDGLTMYYVDLDPREHNFVLTADVLVHQLGPETGANANGQEGVGIMARDLNGPPRQDPMIPGFEEYPAASNFASVMVMRNGVAAVNRSGVTEPWGTVGSARPVNWFAQGGVCNATVDVPITMTLERTDTEFTMSGSWTGTDGSDCSYERSRPGADLVQVQEDDNMTVGLFASRNVAATFSNVSLTLSAANTVASEPEPAPVRALVFDNLSPAHSSSTDYVAAFRATYPGTLSLTANGELVGELELEADEVVSQDVALDVGDNAMSATFTASAGPTQSPQVRNWDVEVREFAQADLVVSPDGTSAGQGTEESPVDLVTALRFVAPGHAVLMAEGTYDVTSNIVIGPGYRGTAERPKTLKPLDGADVVLDGAHRSNVSRIIMLEADHWHVQGFRITQSGSNGLRVSGSNNVVEQMVFNHNRDSGFQLSGSGSDNLRWPANNLILNSESHDNRDLSDINADGFAAKLGVGPGNVFRGNVAHHNIDDGWDLYNRLNEGANFPIVLEGNIAYNNGFLSDGYNRDGGTGNGFKLGGEGLPVDHVLTGNLASGNNMDGFSDNFNPGQMVVTNNTAVDNGRYNFLFRASPYFEDDDQSILRNNLSLSVQAGRPSLPDATAADVDASNFLWDGTRTVNSEGVRVNPNAEFISLQAPATFDRDGDGNLVRGTYTQPRWNSFLAHSGHDGGHVGAVEPQTKPGRGHLNPPGQGGGNQTPPGRR